MHLLLIEDDPVLSHILKRDLEERGFRVETSLDGEEGLYKATNWPFDMVVLDSMLPKLDGWGVLHRLSKTLKNLGCSAAYSLDKLRYRLAPHVRLPSLRCR